MVLVSWPLPATLTVVRAGGLVQEVVPEGVRIQGVLRPLAADRLDQVWFALSTLHAPAAKSWRRSPAERLADYGIDADARLVGGRLRACAGSVSGDTGYLWDGGTRRLASASPRTGDQAASISSSAASTARTLVPTVASPPSCASGGLRIGAQRQRLGRRGRAAGGRR